jgi:cytochrome c oxidase assembly protein subunit 20
MEGGLAKEEKDKELLERKLFLMGTDVGSIPCFRNSFLYGITSGFVAGIGHFAVTSRVKQATSFGFWSYIGVTFSYWCYCRYAYSATKMQYERLKYAMQQSVTLEGTSEGLAELASRSKLEDETKKGLPKEPVKT